LKAAKTEIQEGAEAIKEGGKFAKRGKTALKAAGEVARKGMKVAAPVVKTAGKAVPFVGAGVAIAEGSHHLSEGRYFRAGVDFAEAIPLVGDVVLSVDVTVQGVVAGFQALLEIYEKAGPGGYFTGGIVTPHVFKPMGSMHCFAGQECSYRSGR
jgi:hypothetical protein